jgi:hypothetical protein
VWLVTRFASGAVAEPSAAVNPYATWLVAVSSVVQMITAPVLPMARVDTPAITGAVLSIDSGSSVTGGGCIGVAGDFPHENGPMANTIPPIMAAVQTSPIPIMSRLLTFLMMPSACRRLET